MKACTAVFCFLKDAVLLPQCSASFAVCINPLPFSLLSLPPAQFVNVRMHSLALSRVVNRRGSAQDLCVPHDAARRSHGSQFFVTQRQPGSAQHWVPAHGWTSVSLKPRGCALRSETPCSLHLLKAAPPAADPRWLKCFRRFTASANDPFPDAPKPPSAP